MTTSTAGIDLIKNFEGCKLTAYKPVPTERYWTIGYGHYGADVYQGMKINQAKADELLTKDLRDAESCLNKMGINFKQRQFDALVSWIFNLGTGNFKNSTMRKYIANNFKDVEITDQLIKWYHSSGTPLLGLKKRRVAEANMFLGKETYYLDKTSIIRRR